jgi:methyl-accepting chemotaxis protein
MSIQSMLRQHDVRTRMRVAIGVILFLLVAVGGIGVYGLMQGQALQHDYQHHNFEETSELSRMRQDLGAMQRAERDILLHAGDEAALQTHWQALKTAASSMRQQGDNMLQGEEDEDNPIVRRIQGELAQHEQLWAARLPQLKAESQASGGWSAETQAVLQLASRIGQHLDDIDKVMRAESASSATEVDANVQRFLWLFGLSLALSMLLVVPFMELNARSICDPLDQARRTTDRIAQGHLNDRVEIEGRDESARMLQSLHSMQASLRDMVSGVRVSADAIENAAGEIASGNMDLSGRTENAASSLQQTASSMEQLNGNMQHSMASAQQANQLALSAASSASRGHTIVQEVVDNMNDIDATSRRITDIIGVIDGIAFQTNILALNAAVEAARAGEQGRGFAVVAAEVRALAQRSANAAREIKQLISASGEKVESGTRLVRDAGNAMGELIQNVQKVSDMISEVTASATEQGSGLGQISQAVTHLDQMTQQNAALVEQSAAAASSLRDQAQSLARSVAVFKL